MENKGRIALVVGGSRGIGRAIVLRLARSGFDIWLTCRQASAEAEATVAEVQRIGRACELLLFDLSDHEQTCGVLRAQVEKATPYAVVFNAGIARDGLMVWMSRQEWRSVMSVNLDGFHSVMSVVLLPMLHRKEGRIVAITSLSGQVGQAGQVNYSASKAGLIGAVKALAREIGRKNIIVNAVAPGVIETAMTEQLPREQILPLIPLQRYGSPDDVAAVVDFLCSEEAMYVHGQVIGVNGGMAS